MVVKKTSFKIIGAIVALILIVMFCFLGYRLSFRKEIEKIDSSAINN